MGPKKEKPSVQMKNEAPDSPLLDQENTFKYSVKNDPVVVGVGSDEAETNRLKAMCVDLSDRITAKDEQMQTANEQISEYKRQIDEFGQNEENNNKLQTDLNEANVKYSALDSEFNQLKESNATLTQT